MTVRAHMSGSPLIRLVSVALVLAVASLKVAAQSVDDCMTATGQEAVSVCKRLLSKGDRSAAVYYRLSSTLYQTGETKEALQTIEEGLSLHPANASLINLRNTLLTSLVKKGDSSETTNQNQAATRRDQLKIDCLTRYGQPGIDACRGYLAQTNIDGDRIRQRLLTLEGAKSAAAPSTEQPAHRRLVQSVQSELIALGFDAGTPDGISGPQTRNAIRSFYEAAGLTPRSDIDKALLRKLQTEKSRLNTAEQFLNASRKSAERGALSDAMALLNLAKRSSPLLRIPDDYRQSLADQLAANEPTMAGTDVSTPVTTDDQDPPAASTTTTEASVPMTADDETPSEPSSTPHVASNSLTVDDEAPSDPSVTTREAELSQLLTQIELLESELNVRSSDGEARMQVIREAVSGAFDQ